MMSLITRHCFTEKLEDYLSYLTHSATLISMEIKVGLQEMKADLQEMKVRLHEMKVGLKEVKVGLKDMTNTTKITKKHLLQLQ